MAKAKAPNFESALSELEQLVHTMESGELSLEDSLKAFEKGIPYGIPISLSCLIFTALSALSH